MTLFAELATARERNLARLQSQRAVVGQYSMKNRDARCAAFDARVLHELATGPRSVACIVRVMDSYDNRVKSSLYRLQRSGRVLVIGTAFDLGRRDLHQRALIWALVGTPVLAKRPVLAGGNKRRAVYGSVVRVPAPKRRPAPDPERVAGWRTIGRGLAGWGGWGNWR